MRKRVIIVVMFLFLLLLAMYGVLHLASRESFDVTYGISFNQNHAESLGLDWKETYNAMLEELKPPVIRVAAMWSGVEAEKDVFDFADVDYMMDQAEEHGAQVLLVVGQKAPRWPECHVPTWVLSADESAARMHLLEYVKATVGRYHNHPALELWQVENEAFINFQFGECEGFQKDAVEDELELVRSMDPNHRVVMTDSGELATWRKPAQLADILGTTLYRVVQTPSGKTITYDWLPAGFYKLKARLWGKQTQDFFVAELQTEPWFTGSDPTNTSVQKQEETMNPERMKQHIEYVQHVGASRAYLWGIEWWYFMKQIHGDARYWEIARDALGS